MKILLRRFWHNKWFDFEYHIIHRIFNTTEKSYTISCPKMLKLKVTLTFRKKILQHNDNISDSPVIYEIFKLYKDIFSVLSKKRGWSWKSLNLMQNLIHFYPKYTKITDITLTFKYYAQAIILHFYHGVTYDRLARWNVESTGMYCELLQMTLNRMGNTVDCACVSGCM